MLSKKENEKLARVGPGTPATLEVVLAILQSSREGREITLSHQVPCIA